MKKPENITKVRALHTAFNELEAALDNTQENIRIAHINQTGTIIEQIVANQHLRKALMNLLTVFSFNDTTRNESIITLQEDISALKIQVANLIIEIRAND